MSKKHPCQKIVLNQTDRLLLVELEKRGKLSFAEALVFTGLQKEQLLKRLKSLHRDGILRFYKKAGNRIRPSLKIFSVQKDEPIFLHS